MKLRYLTLFAALALSLGPIFAAETPSSTPSPDAAKKKGPPPGGKKGGPGGASQESAEMQALLKSFNLTPEQQAKYAAARKETSEKMRAVSKGKADGTMPQQEVLKQALAAHKAYNAAVKEILTPEQYEKWLPLRESDHHKIAQAHKERDAAAAKGKSTPPPPAN
jgi:Spy/CpxP family protein refolding chaperone